MNIHEITLPKAEARAAYEAYREAIKQRHSKEDEQIARGYKALAQGKRIINLQETIKAGGLETQTRAHGRGTVQLPCLAICRASVEWCFIVTQSDGSCMMQEHDGWVQDNARANVRRFPAGTLGESNIYTRCEFAAMVPVVPAALRPAAGLHNYHVLWEADWKRQPPIDPYLLKHLGGDLYAVLAQWDLTELERAVMAGRRSG